MTRVTARQVATARGCLLGLVLGDAVGTAGGTVPADGPLRGSSASQLACFTVEGTIRASVRARHRGVCHPPSVVWHAYQRWAANQGIAGARKDDWPDGWLAGVQALAARRGSAPATVKALQGGKMGTPKQPVGTSLGAHALTRTLPTGLIVPWGPPEPARFAAEVAVTTHGPGAAEVAGLGAAIVARLAEGGQIGDAVMSALGDVEDGASRSAGAAVTAALTAAGSQPGRPDVLARLAPDERAVSALAGAVYVAASLPGRGDLRAALLLAATAGDGGHVATTTGALLGALHGADALPVEWVARLELAWVADILARDLLSQLADHPSGSEYVAGPDPHWRGRYPGW